MRRIFSTEWIDKLYSLIINDIKNEFRREIAIVEGYATSSTTWGVGTNVYINNIPSTASFVINDATISGTNNSLQLSPGRYLINFSFSGNAYQGTNGGAIKLYNATLGIYQGNGTWAQAYDGTYESNPWTSTGNALVTIETDTDFRFITQYATTWVYNNGHPNLTVCIEKLKD